MDAPPAASSSAEQGDPVTLKVGSTKPLQRFFRREPKTVGVVMLFLGSAGILLGIPMKKDVLYNSAHSYTVFWLGALFIICGILYVLSERNPSKKLVTASLALSIVSTIGALVSFFAYLKQIIFPFYGISNYDYQTAIIINEEWLQFHEHLVWGMELIWCIHSLVGAVILIVMTVFARHALRSMRTQATVIIRNQQSQ